MPKVQSAGAIVFRKEEGKIYYLLLHYPEGHWEFVKGKIDKGESLYATIMREAKEETGIKDLKIIKGFKEVFSYFFKTERGVVHKTVFFFLAETKTKEIQISSEHLAYKWLLYNDALKQMKFKGSKGILEKANSFLKNNNRGKIQ